MVKITIRIYENTAIVREMKFTEKDKARSVYFANAFLSTQYTQLIVGKREYTTAEADKYFGRMGRDSAMLNYTTNALVSEGTRTVRGVANGKIYD